MRAALTVFLALVLAAPASALDADGLARTLTRQMRRAGPASGAYVADVGSRVPLFGFNETVPRLPASTEKLWTTAAVLTRLGPRARLTTAVLKDQPIDLFGTVNGNLYLRGAGDPTLSSRDMGALARQVRRDGVLHVSGRVVGDASAFDRRRGLAAFGYQATPDVPPLSALMLDRGQIDPSIVGYQRHPATFAAAELTRALRRRGVTVGDTARAGRTPLLGFAVGAVRSPPLGRLLRAQNHVSDNYVAEMLLRTLGRGTTAGGATVVRQVARRRFGVRPVVVDGSGITRGDASTPIDLASMLVDEARNRAFVSSLPVAGRSGTLAYRLTGPLTTGRCRAKTGTLDDVSALAGYCQTLGGRTLAFAILQNGVSPFTARLVQDTMVTAMVRYQP